MYIYLFIQLQANDYDEEEIGTEIISDEELFKDDRDHTKFAEEAFGTASKLEESDSFDEEYEDDFF